MQNLLSKFAVLATVISVSCFVVWQAHLGLESAQKETEPDEFLALNAGEDGDNAEIAIPDFAESSGFADRLDPIPGIEGDASEPEPTLADPLLTEGASKSSTDAHEVPNPFSFASRTVPHQQETSEQSPATLTPQADERVDSQPPSQEEDPFLALNPSPVESETHHAAEVRNPFETQTPVKTQEPVKTQRQERSNPFLPLFTGESQTPQPVKDLATERVSEAAPEPRHIDFGGQELRQGQPVARSEMFGPSHREKPAEENSGHVALAPILAEPEVQPRTADEPAGLTKLPPSHPGPILLSPESTGPGPVRNAVAEGIPSNGVERVAGEEAPQDLFLPFATPPVTNREVQGTGRSTQPVPSTPKPQPSEPELVLPNFEEMEAATGNSADTMPSLPEDIGLGAKPIPSSAPKNVEPANPFLFGNEAPAEIRPMSGATPLEGVPADQGKDQEPVLPTFDKLPEISPRRNREALPNLNATESISPEPALPNDTPKNPFSNLPTLESPKSTPPKVSEPGNNPFDFGSIDSQPTKLPVQESAPNNPFGNNTTPTPKPTATPNVQPLDTLPVMKGTPNGSVTDDSPVLPNFNVEPTRQPEPKPATDVPRTFAPDATVDSLQPKATPLEEMELLGDGTVNSEDPMGLQSPKLQIEKVAPEAATIGDPVIYKIIVRNIGGSPAHSVIVEDRIPRGARLEGTIPQAVLTGGKLVWDLGTLAPRAERTIQLKVTPIESGEIGSVASVRFATSVATTIRITAPKLNLEMKGPSEVLVGKPVTFDFKIANTGEGDAKNVFLRALIPAGLKHPGGNDLEYEIGSLPAGQAREVQLTMTAAELGIFTPQAVVSLNGEAKDERKSDLRIIDSRLQITRTGPTNRFVNRPAAFTTKVTNQSSLPLRNVALMEQLPNGVEPPAGTRNWDPQRRVITWAIPEIQSGETKEFQIELTPTFPGNFKGTLIAQDNSGNRATLDTELQVKGIPDLDVDINRDLAPVVVGEQVSLRMSVSNTGNANANNVHTAFQIPTQLEFVEAKGPVKYRFDPTSNVISFEPLPQISPQDKSQKYDYDIVLTAAAPGESEVQVFLGSDEEKQQFTKRVTVLGTDQVQPSSFLLGK